MHMVEISSMEDFESLEKNSWGIPEPRLTDNRTDCFMAGGLDLVLMPGLAFDAQRNRIGYGKGYYDRFLQKSFEFAELRSVPKPVTIAIALSVQMVEQVPVDDTDIKPDFIINGI
jgi:5-formyltetrahydrofolate cyclo-ligase